MSTKVSGESFDPGDLVVWSTGSASLVTGKCESWLSFLDEDGVIDGQYEVTLTFHVREVVRGL